LIVCISVDCTNRKGKNLKICRQGRQKVQRTDLAAKAAKNAKEKQKQKIKIKMASLG